METDAEYLERIHRAYCCLLLLCICFWPGACCAYFCGWCGFRTERLKKGEDGKPLKSRSGENLNLSDLLDEAKRLLDGGQRAGAGPSQRQAPIETRRARGCPGPSCVGKCTVRARPPGTRRPWPMLCWRTHHARRARAAARAASVHAAAAC